MRKAMTQSRPQKNVDAERKSYYQKQGLLSCMANWISMQVSIKSLIMKFQQKKSISFCWILRAIPTDFLIGSRITIIIRQTTVNNIKMQIEPRIFAKQCESYPTGSNRLINSSFPSSSIKVSFMLGKYFFPKMLTTLMYGKSKVATSVSPEISTWAFSGTFTSNIGMCTVIYIPLIRPQICAKLPEMTVLSTTDATTTAVVAAFADSANYEAPLAVFLTAIELRSIQTESSLRFWN